MAEFDVEALDSTMHYVDEGAGRPLVMLHGNPTSSYLWRDVIEGLRDVGRCVAPDLIGMGRSGKPDSCYRFFDHADYLDAWFDALDLRDVVLVGHDWGGALGFHWARRHPDRVAGLVFFETVIRPRRWDDMQEPRRGFFEAVRTVGDGDDLILDQNAFVEFGIAAGVLRSLSDAEIDRYREPFPTRESRRVMLRWTREVPLDGQPADVCKVVEDYDAWLMSSDIPKLYLTFEPGLSTTPADVAWAKANLANCDVQVAGEAKHYAQEDCPGDIVRAVREWLFDHGLVTS